MPELPEVENTKLSLLPIIGTKVVDVYTSGKRLRQEIPQNLVDIKNSTIIDVQRKAKYLLFHLSNQNNDNQRSTVLNQDENNLSSLVSNQDNDNQNPIVLNQNNNNQKTIVSHLGMSGKFIYSEDNNINKHDHVVLSLSNGYTLKYNDPRRFGVFLLENTNDYQAKLFSKVAMDAIDDEFTPEYLQTKLAKISSNIKNTLLNQEVVAGIGNIYASEALFQAKISPLRDANSLKYNELNDLVSAVKEILQKSIILGGSTLKDYKKANGESGGFQDHFLVYARENKPCSHKNCDGIITKITQNGRSTFYCPKSQK